MFKRLLVIDKNMHESALILGPRGTGKTHWLKASFPNDLYFDLLDTEIFVSFLSNPVNLSARIPDNYSGWVIIDEVQKIPALLNEVHRLIEHKGYRFILTGSSARSLRKSGVNLLAGRALTYSMHPLLADELGDKFDLSFALQFGMMPALYKSSDPKHYLHSYVQTYLKEEVQQEALTRNLALFTKFLSTASFSQGEILSYTEISREIGSNRQTVVNFFEILEDLLIASRIPVFNKRAKRKMVAQPKFYYFDVGVFRSLRPVGPLDTDSEISGAALETLFLQQARAVNDYFRMGYNFYYWRTQSQKEVDFILYGNDGLYAFEIKRKKDLTPKDFKGLRLFKEDYSMAKCYLFYGGSKSYHDNGIDVIPYEKGLKDLRSILEAR